MRNPKQTIDRRTALAGAGAAGALVTVVAVLPKAAAPQAGPEAETATPAPDDGGYRLTEHVKRYYASTRI